MVLGLVMLLPNLLAKMLLIKLITCVIVIGCCSGSAYAAWSYGPVKLLAEVLERINYNPFSGAQTKFEDFGEEARDDFEEAFEKF